MQTVHHSAAHHTHSVLHDSPGRAHHMYTADCQQPLSLRSCLNSKTRIFFVFFRSSDPSAQVCLFHHGKDLGGLRHISQGRAVTPFRHVRAPLLGQIFPRQGVKYRSECPCFCHSFKQEDVSTSTKTLCIIVISSQENHSAANVTVLSIRQLGYEGLAAPPPPPPTPWGDAWRVRCALSPPLPPPPSLPLGPWVPGPRLGGVLGVCCAVLCCAVLCCAVLCCAVLCCAVLCCAVLCCAVLCCAVLCCAVLCCAVLCCAVLCCAVLCCAVLCCAVLCCAVLCCAVLCVSNPPQQTLNNPEQP